MTSHNYDWARDSLTGKSVLIAVMTDGGLGIAYDVACPSINCHEMPTLYPFDPQGKQLSPELAREMLAVYLG